MMDSLRFIHNRKPSAWWWDVGWSLAPVWPVVANATRLLNGGCRGGTQGRGGGGGRLPSLGKDGTVAWINLACSFKSLLNSTLKPSQATYKRSFSPCVFKSHNMLHLSIKLMVKQCQKWALSLWCCCCCCCCCCCWAVCELFPLDPGRGWCCGTFFTSLAHFSLLSSDPKASQEVCCSQQARERHLAEEDITSAELVTPFFFSTRQKHLQPAPTVYNHSFFSLIMCLHPCFVCVL